MNRQHRRNRSLRDHSIPSDVAPARERPDVIVMSEEPGTIEEIDAVEARYRFILRRLIDEIDATIAGLPEPDLGIFEDRYRHGMPFREIARKHDVSVGQAHGVYKRVKALLASRFAAARAEVEEARRLSVSLSS